VKQSALTSPPDADKGRIGFWVASALVVGNVIGAGIFLLPATLAPYGWNGVVGWFVTLAGALSLAWVFAELSRTFPEAGGAFGFMRLSLGDAPAFIGAWGYWVSVWVANAAIATGATAYLTRLVPAVETAPGLAPLVTVGIVWLVTWINLLGVRAVGGVQVVTTVIKLLPFVAVLALVAVRLGVDGSAALAPFDRADLSWSGVIGATTLSLYALLGIESAAVPADRVKDPARTIPAATMFGTWLTGIISVVCCSAVVLDAAGTGGRRFVGAIRALSVAIVRGLERGLRGAVRHRQRLRGAQRVGPAVGRAPRRDGRQRAVAGLVWRAQRQRRPRARHRAEQRAHLGAHPGQLLQVDRRPLCLRHSPGDGDQPGALPLLQRRYAHPVAARVDALGDAGGRGDWGAALFPLGAVRRGGGGAGVGGRAAVSGVAIASGGATPCPARRRARTTARGDVPLPTAADVDTIQPPA
jgi:hypothetical protein